MYMSITNQLKVASHDFSIDDKIPWKSFYAVLQNL